MRIHLSKNNENLQQIKVFCQDCEKETNHLIWSSVPLDGHNEEYDVVWHAIYQIIQCLGCDAMSFRSEHWDSETNEYDGGASEILYQRWSPKVTPNKNYRQYSDLPSSIDGLYRETIECYNNGILILCAGGIRALVEGICLEKQIHGKNLEEKIDNLCAGGYLTKDNANVLHQHRLLGNKALHELSVPRKDVLRISIGIIESMLELLYEIPSQVQELERAKKRGQK